jgi:uncharacterized protein (TIGR02145 family)
VSSHAQPLTSKTITKASLTVNSSSTFTDATGCPGIGSLYCPYTGSDLYMDATHLCQQRTSGAKNWEAWIKDTRDTELYRIVLMPDNNWWLAQNVKLATYNSTTVGDSISGCKKDDCGRRYTWAQAYGSYGGTSGSTGSVQGICPSGWLLPLRTTFRTLVNSFSTVAEACAGLRSLDSSCSPRTNPYGFANVIGVVNGNMGKRDTWYTNDAGREDGMGFDVSCAGCNTTCTANDGEDTWADVRCFR